MENIVEFALHDIMKQLQKKKKLLVAIDGRCAAGKTTLATRLQELIICNVIHMDHFYLRLPQRTAERLSEPGGNVDHERFLEEVLLPLKEGRDFSYRPYDCLRQDFGEKVYIDTNAVNIVEGSYSCHPALRGYYDLRIFLSVCPEEQKRRIRQRNGDVQTADFIDKWIPLEEKYFLLHHVQESSDLCYDT
jgi:uridine kinase